MKRKDRMVAQRKMPDDQGRGSRFSSNEQSDGLIPPPQLEVSYNVVPEPGVIGLLVLPACLAMRRRR